MIHYEYSYIDEVMKFVKTQDKTAIPEEFARKAILNCFSKISMSKTAEVNIGLK